MARRLVAALSILALVVASIGHICGHQEALSDNGSLAVSMTADAPGSAQMSDGNTLAGHHCGTCVGVVLSDVPRMETASIVSSPVHNALVPALHPHGPTLHTPPPKSLT